MGQDLSNARIIEWVFKSEGYRDELRVANRDVRGAPFRFGGATLMTETRAAALGARVVASFPAPSLSEIVGDAPAFIFRDTVGELCIAGRSRLGDRWTCAVLSDADLGLDELPVVGLASVVPLRPAKDGER